MDLPLLLFADDFGDELQLFYLDCPVRIDQHQLKEIIFKTKPLKKCEKEILFILAFKLETLLGLLFQFNSK